MAINKKYFTIIAVIIVTILSLVYFCLTLSLMYKLVIAAAVAISGAKIYTSFCNYQGKLRKNL